jgi:hypothetical protein
MGNETLCYFVVLFDGELFHDQNFDMRLVAQIKAHGVFFSAHRFRVRCGARDNPERPLMGRLRARQRAKKCWQSNEEFYQPHQASPSARFART